METIELIKTNWEQIATGAFALYEIIIRLIPTSKSWSIMELLGRLIPDRKIPTNEPK